MADAQSVLDIDPEPQCEDVECDGPHPHHDPAVDTWRLACVASKARRRAAGLCVCEPWSNEHEDECVTREWGGVA